MASFEFYQTGETYMTPELKSQNYSQNILNLLIQYFKGTLYVSPQILCESTSPLVPRKLTLHALKLSASLV